MNATPGLFGPIEGRRLPPVIRRAYRIIMVVGEREFYITTHTGTEKKAQLHARRLQVRTGKRHIVRLATEARE